MAVSALDEHYRCNVCGNEVRVVKVGVGTLVCCGQEMELVAVHEPKVPDDEIPV